MATSPDTLQLTMTLRNQLPVRMFLTEERITMGRSTSCTIPISDAFLSREHAEIRRVGDEWILSDRGSVNGTFLNGFRVTGPVPIKPGDSILLGDAEIRINDDTVPTTREFTVTTPDHHSSPSLTMSVADIALDRGGSNRDTARLDILNRLAMEFLEDRPMTELFDFIVDRVMDALTPSRVALGILAPNRDSFAEVKVRCRDIGDSENLAISQTLLTEVVEGRKAVAFTDVSQSEKLAHASSIMDQQIRSALCAPLIVSDEVMGVLYIDYILTQRPITEEDVKLAGKIARIAARKLETTRLREESTLKQKLDEEMKTAFLIQSRLLPAESLRVAGYRFEGYYRPCRTVSGDYYDFVERPDGRVYFIIADVSGKGLTAALVMAGVAAAFNTLTNYDLRPSRILADLNRMLARKTEASTFVTALCGVLDPKRGEIVYSNAGHNRPFLCKQRGPVRQIEARAGLVLGVLPGFQFKDETLTLDRGETLYLYTDGLSDATNPADEMFTEARLQQALEECTAPDARGIALASIAAIDKFVEGAPQADDMTLMCVQQIPDAPTPEETSLVAKLPDLLRPR